MNEYQKMFLEAEYRRISKSVKAWFRSIPVVAVLMFLFSAILTGCTATESVIREYDADGNLVKKTYTSESLVKDVTESTKNKTVIAWENGWAAYLSASTATEEDPTPHVKMFAGKTDKGVISALPNQTGWDGITSAILATHYGLEVSATGIKTSGETEKAKTAGAAETAPATK